MLPIHWDPLRDLGSPLGTLHREMGINVEGRDLTLRGERKTSKETKNEDYLLRELQSGSFLRRLTLPEGVDTERSRATCRNGVLEISMPMAKTLGGRKVLIAGAEEGANKIH